MNNKIFISINSTYFFRFAGLNFDGILERLFNKGNNTSTLIARPKVLTKIHLFENFEAEEFLLIVIFCNLRILKSLMPAIYKLK